MPTYEYQCSKCKKRFEKLQSMSEPPLKKCPHCGGKAERQISAGAGLIFKGSGFYITDYKNKTDAKRPKPEAKKEAKTEKKSETPSKDKK